ncbi:MAG: HAD family hydrolase [Acidimicrobiia bacterium]
MRHIVWDWNGTLFDDLEIVVDSVNTALVLVGAPPITVDRYQSHYTRPVSLFYEELLERPVSQEEWHRLDVAFHDHYAAVLDQATLAPNATEALELVDRSGASQSLLSMFLHDELVELVERLGIRRYMNRVDGLRGIRGDRKHLHLEEHLGALATKPSEVVVIGDALDDAAAARAVGAAAVLYDSGSHLRERLEETGVPIADTLVDSVNLALDL